MEHCSNDKFWGEHLVINVKSCNDNVLDKEAILQFKDELVKQIDMEQHGEPLIEHFGSGDLAGWTLVQLIKTSNIIIHFCDKTKNFYGDIFSCKRFDVGKVRDCVRKWFEPKMIQELVLERGV